MENNYLIYKIINNITNKIYIGKTKEYYGTNNINGIEGRFKQHIVNSKSKTKFNDCPMLYNAIRKYDSDNFKIELLEKTTKEQVNIKEIEYIKLYDSTNSLNGYNISLGGDGRSVVIVNETTREKISKAQNKNILIMTDNINIKKYIKNDIHIGYTVARKERGTNFRKYFTSKKYTIEENYEKALDWLNNIKNNKKDDSLKYNKDINLPKYIYVVKDKKTRSNIIGYFVNITRNGKKFMKSFQSKNKNLDQLLKEAIEFKNKSLTQL